MRFAAAGLAAAAFAAACGCATAGSAQVQTDLDAIQDQLWKIQKDNAAMLGQIDALRAVPTAGAGLPALVELRARLETVESELRALRLRAEESDGRLRVLSEELRATRARLDAPGRNAPPVAAPGVVVSPALGGEPGSGAGPGPASTADRLRAGEAFLAHQQYAEAIAAFDEVIRDPAAGGMAAAAYLKKGFALLELNRTADAVVHLQHVAAAYPGTEEARLARERLQALGIGVP